MLRANLLLPLLALVASTGWLLSHGVGPSLASRTVALPPGGYSRSSANAEKTKLKATAIRSYAAKGNFNTSICFLVDMSLASGENRFFVYDLVHDSIQKAGLVTHGRCKQWWLQGRKYGNTIGCGCTSLGRYRIGHPYTGKFGQAFKLYGLDKTNDKAFDRFVVLHSHDCVPETEVKNEICQSDGCPTVAPGFLAYLTPILKGSGKPVLLWIYE